MAGVQFGADRSGIPTLDDLIAMMNAKRAAALEGAPSLSEAVAGVPGRVADAVTQRAQGFGNVAADIGREGFFPWYNRQPPIDKQQLTDAAMGFMPGGIMGKLETGGIRAFHGSPHSFDKFEWSPRTIGTGEGAQAYGHGLYFAGAEDVAKTYRDQLRWKGANFDDAQVIAKNAMDRVGDRAAAADDLQRALESTNRFYRGKVPAAQAGANKQTEQAIALLRGDDPITGTPPTPGHMYEVNIAAEPHQLLDWDKTISQQPEVEKALESAGINPWRPYVPNRKMPPTGAEAYHNLARSSAEPHPNFDTRSPHAASQKLKDAGIPGIQFLDQGSRAAGDGTRNYVIFNPDIIKILRKYGVGGMALPAAGAGLAFGDQGQQ